MSERWYRYVPWGAWPRWAALGWVFVGDLGPPHGFYSGLWEWRGVGEPREPEEVEMSRRSEAERRERETLGELRDVQAGRAASAPVPVAERRPKGDDRRAAPEIAPFDLCIYHADCADGFAAAWAVWKRLPRIEMLAARYGEPAPQATGRRIVIVDFSFPEEELRRLAERNAALLVIDHHHSAVRALGGRFEPAPPRLEDWPQTLGSRGAEPRLLLDERRSGAGLAWRFFHDGAPVPRIVDYVEDRDLWRFALPNSLDVTEAIGATPFALPEWVRIARMLEDEHGYEAQCVAGRALRAARRKHVEAVIAATRRLMRIGGRVVPVANAPKHLASDVGNALAREAAFAAVYFDRADGRREFSLRSAGGDDFGFDVALVAERYGGGGHKHAAGFVADPGWEGDVAPSPSPG